ncbi:MAG: tRNA dimethylallyltransferase [Candidatus Berkelbacteria bacterium Licking1014_96]|uniref:tRNA dimethylallyltransferase n=1 Tax=Candidatus Berkelbacteria bacterium Licking1014_96 TaxID=2017149 RepID=A0A554LHL3_9BACT|nr:MAG: tRNA dimethylallyltransferase [Candidatus Berkelbacteria bacterium Licking1014_96]
MAKKFKGEVICADSRTIYKYFDIGTAKPSKKERQGVKHHLLDFVDPQKKVYTVAQFQRDALKTIEDIIKRKKLPIIVGGSALYIYALTRNYQFPGKSDTKLRRELESRSLSELQAIAKRSKKITLNPSDFQNKRRLIRAIEIFRNLKFEIRNSFLSPLPYYFLKIGVDLPRSQIYERIDRRTQSWMNKGLVEEVKNLLRRGIPKDRIIEFGLGYREVIKYLDGEIRTKKELVDRINFSQHAFVRRQMTWFRRDKEIQWCNNITNTEKLVSNFLEK